MSFVSLTQLDYDVAATLGSVSAAPLRAALAQMAQLSGRPGGAVVRPLRVGSPSPAATCFSITVAVIEADGLTPAPRLALSTALKEGAPQWVGLPLSDSSVKGLLLKIWRRRAPSSAYSRYVEPADWATGAASFAPLLLPSATVPSAARPLRPGDVVVIAGVRGAGQEHAPAAENPMTTAAAASASTSSGRSPARPTAGSANPASAGYKPWHWDLKLCDGAQLFLLAGSDGYAAALDSVRALLTLYTHRLALHSAAAASTARASAAGHGVVHAPAVAAATRAAAWLPAGVPVALLQRMADVLIHRCIESGVSLPWLLPSSVLSRSAAPPAAGRSSLPATAASGAGSGLASTAVPAATAASLFPSSIAEGLGGGSSSGLGELMPIDAATRLLADRGFLQQVDDGGLEPQGPTVLDSRFHAVPAEAEAEAGADAPAGAATVPAPVGTGTGRRAVTAGPSPFPPRLHAAVPPRATAASDHNERLVRDIRELLAVQHAGCDAGVVSPLLLRSGRGTASRLGLAGGEPAVDDPVAAAAAASAAAASRAARLAADAPALLSGSRTFTVDIASVHLQPAVAPPQAAVTSAVSPAGGATSSAGSRSAAAPAAIASAAHSVYRPAGSSTWLRRRCATVTLADSPSVPLQLLVFEFPAAAAAAATGTGLAPPLLHAPTASGAGSAAGAGVRAFSAAHAVTSPAAALTSPPAAASAASVRPLKAYADIIQALERAQRAATSRHPASTASGAGAGAGASAAGLPLLRLSGVACMRTAFDDCLVLTTTRLTRVVQHTDAPAAAAKAAASAGSTLMMGANAFSSPSIALQRFFGAAASSRAGKLSAGAASGAGAGPAIAAGNQDDVFRSPVGFKRTMLLKPQLDAQTAQIAGATTSSSSCGGGEPASKRARLAHAAAPELQAAPSSGHDDAVSARSVAAAQSHARALAAANEDSGSSSSSGAGVRTLSRAISISAHVRAVVWPGVGGALVEQLPPIVSILAASTAAPPVRCRVRWVFAPSMVPVPAASRGGGTAPCSPASLSAHGSEPPLSQHHHSPLQSTPAPALPVASAGAAAGMTAAAAAAVQQDVSDESTCRICSAAEAAQLLRRIICTACCLCGAQVEADARGIVSGLCTECSAGGLVAPSQQAVWRFQPAFALLQDCSDAAVTADGKATSACACGAAAAASAPHSPRPVAASAFAWVRVQPHAVEALIGVPAAALATAVASRPSDHALLAPPAAASLRGDATGCAGHSATTDIAGACACLAAAATAASSLALDSRATIAAAAEAAICGVVSSLLLQKQKLVVNALLLPDEALASGKAAVRVDADAGAASLLQLVCAAVSQVRIGESSAIAAPSGANRHADSGMIPLADVEIDEDAAVAEETAAPRPG